MSLPFRPRLGHALTKAQREAIRRNWYDDGADGETIHQLLRDLEAVLEPTYEIGQSVRVHSTHVVRRGVIREMRVEGGFTEYLVDRDVGELPGGGVCWIRAEGIAPLEGPVPEAFVDDLEESLELARWCRNGNAAEDFITTPQYRGIKRS